MPDFREIAARAKAAHEAEIARQDAEASARSNARMRFIAAATEALKQHVLPLLKQAKSALEEDGVGVLIEPDYDVQNRAESIKPSVSMKLMGPIRQKDGYRFKADPVVFVSDGTVISAVYTGGAYGAPKQDFGSVLLVDAGDIVAKAVAHAIRDYYDQLRSSPH